MNQTQKNLMNATMDIIAEVGLDGFSMKQVTDRVGVTTAVVYQYFGTKEQLLYQCFMYVNQQIGDLFADSKLPANASKEQLIRFLHDEWVRYFLMLLHGGKKTLFYYAYRESTYLEKILIRNNEAVAEDMRGFSAVFQDFSEKFQLAQKIDMDYFWVYLLDGTGVFAKRIINRNVPIESVQIEQIWRLLLGGLSGLFI